MWKPGRVDWTDGRVEMEVVVWRAILLDETGSDVKWSAAEQWRMRLDVEERQMRNAEHDDVDEKSASCGVEGSGRERWVVCPDGRSGTWTGTNGRPGVSEIEHHAVEVVDHDVDVVEGVRDCVVVRDGGGGDASLGPEKRHVTEEVQRSGRVVDKDRKSPVDEQAQCVPESGWPLARVQRSMPKVGGTRFGNSYHVEPNFWSPASNNIQI